MAWSAPFSGWLLEAGRRLPVQMNDYPRQNPAYRLTTIHRGAHIVRPFFCGFVVAAGASAFPVRRRPDEIAAALRASQ